MVFISFGGLTLPVSQIKEPIIRRVYTTVPDSILRHPIEAAVSFSTWVSTAGSMTPTYGLRAAPWGDGFDWKIPGM